METKSQNRENVPSHCAHAPTVGGARREGEMTIAWRGANKSTPGATCQSSMTANLNRSRDIGGASACKREKCECAVLLQLALIRQSGHCRRDHRVAG
eukprot:1730251-Rhodomonas_salina.1